MHHIRAHSFWFRRATQSLEDLSIWAPILYRHNTRVPSAHSCKVLASIDVHARELAMYDAYLVLYGITG